MAAERAAAELARAQGAPGLLQMLAQAQRRMDGGQGHIALPAWLQGGVVGDLGATRGGVSRSWAGSCDAANVGLWRSPSALQM